MNQHLKPPVKVPLYQHQMVAFEFVMRVFHADEQKPEHREGGEHDGSDHDHM